MKTACSLPLFLAAALLPVLPARSAGLSRDRPVDLTCEHRIDPLGLDAAQPRLSWHPATDRIVAAGQSAYQIMVGTQLDRIAPPPQYRNTLEDGAAARGSTSPLAADVWDSSKVTSAQAVDVPYGGQPLRSLTRYYWKVRTWDSTGKAGDWSEVGWWETGLLKPEDWHARWIGPPEGGEPGQPGAAAYFLKTFVVEGGIKSAMLYACARDAGEFTLDGEVVGADRVPASPASAETPARYTTYDLTGKITEGLNAFGAMVASPRDGADLSLLAQIRVVYTNGKSVLFATDSSWKCARGPLVRLSPAGGQTYDGRRELGDWAAPGYPVYPHYRALDWKPVAELPVQDFNLTAQSEAPLRPQAFLRAQSVQPSGDRSWRFDFGRSISGRVKLVLRGPLGQTATLRFGAELGADGRVRDSDPDRYIQGSDPVVQWEPDFAAPRTFRYVEIDGLDQPPVAAAILAIPLQP